ncbi:MAG: phosphoribosyltransferase [Bacteroidetes bacterium]|nr:phosphoribosyltransferase [Bacteroidota bacterium]
MRSLILDKRALKQKITRLAFQICEDLFEEEELCLIGIMSGGYRTAKLLQAEIEKIKSFKLNLSSLKINKEKPFAQKIELSEELDFYKNKACLIVDDVANSGRTIFYALEPFSRIELKSMKVAVLVDRTHKKFPIACDFVGTSLATTIREHIEVVFEEEDVEAAYLI